MTSKNLQELISGEIDGLNGPEESAHLQELLAHDPDARTLYDDFQAVTRLLASGGEVDVPPTLKPNVLRALSSSAVPRSSRRTILEMMFGWLRPPVVRRYAYAFCGGVATGVLAYALLFHATPPSPVAPSDASATIVLKEPDRSLEGGTSYAVSSDHLKGTLTTNQLNDLQVLRVRLQSDQAVVTEITFDQTQLSVDAVRRLHGSPESVLIRNGAVEIHGSGDTAWSLFFSERTRTISPIRVVIRSSSEVLFEKLIPLSVSAPG